MGSLSASLSIADSGLAAVNAQLALVSHNIANASTAGYVAEQLGQSSLTAAGQGDGVVTGIATRSLDTQLQQDLFAENGTVGALSTTQAALQSIDAVQGTVAGGNDLSSKVAALQSSFTELESDPSSQTGQAAVVSSAQDLASQINTLGNTYTVTRQNVQDGLVSDVKSLNQELGTIGSLTDQIMAGRADNQSTADLESQRDATVAAVSSLVGVKYLEQPDGDMVITTSGGMTLPIHSANPLSLADAVVGPDDSRQLGDVPGIMLSGQDVTANLIGGSIGAGVTLRDVTLPIYQASLDQFSQTLTTRFSQQGLSLFTGANGVVPGGGGGGGGGVIQAGYVGYSLSIQVNPTVVANPALVRDGTGSIAGSATGASSFSPNTDSTQTGFSTLIDRVLDYSFGSQVQSGVAQSALTNTGLGPAGNLAGQFGFSNTLSSAASALVGAQSQDIATATSRLADEQAVQTTLQAKFSAGSAVNTDTELAAMVSLQASYGANAKIFTAVQAMWTQLLAAVT